MIDNVVFNDDLSNSSNESANSVKSNPETKTIIMTVPIDKKVKIPRSGTASVVTLENTIQDVMNMIEAGEKVVQHINNVSVICCSSGTCSRIFNFFFRAKVGKVTVV